MVTRSIWAAHPHIKPEPDGHQPVIGVDNDQFVRGLT